MEWKELAEGKEGSRTRNLTAQASHHFLLAGVTCSSPAVNLRIHIPSQTQVSDCVCVCVCVCEKKDERGEESAVINFQPRPLGELLI